MADLFHVHPESSIWTLLAHSDADLERIDLVILNLAVARGIQPLKGLDVRRYIRVVDDWTAPFAQFLPGSEARNFNKSPGKWHNDIHFFRMGMLAGFLGGKIGVAYIEEQRDQKFVHYTNPSDLFLCGVIDSRRGTCCNLAQLHVAIARRMGWPVSLCSAENHWLSRFDDGKTAHTIETSKIDSSGSFASGPDEWYLEKFQLPRKAIECGSELRRLTAREMIGAFLACRGRHHADIRRHDLADVDYALARHLFPNHRETYFRSVSAALLSRGRSLFEPGEHYHTDSACRSLPPDAETIYPSQNNAIGVRFDNPLLRHYPETVFAVGHALPKGIQALTERKRPC